jgi:hypothetical protein
MDEKQIEMYDIILENCATAREAIDFFLAYCGLQVLDDKMYEYLRRIEWRDENVE